MPSPEVFVTTMIESTTRRRLSYSRRTSTSYVALSSRLERSTLPGTIALEPLKVGRGVGGAVGAGVGVGACVGGGVEVLVGAGVAVGVAAAVGVGLGPGVELADGVGSALTRAVAAAVAVAVGGMTGLLTAASDDATVGVGEAGAGDSGPARKAVPTTTVTTSATAARPIARSSNRRMSGRW
jgi:hypothetical protein